ncbi:MAG: S-methyl-5'-thioadenosine phosphorylase [Candidatus Omnitrophica bacterium]|nr:S-methyl-5'-thioadenosine phosphorylase [Candidatus Omnitrophota bacterium]
MAKIGVIGGSGLYKIEGIENVETLSLFTPFGQPSGNFIKGKLAGVEVVFLPRHGKDHAISPTEINYRANIFGMKKLGVQAIISVSACGSLREEMKPMDFVVPDQFVDLTKHRKSSFFEGGVVGHVSVADPFSPEIRKIIIGAARELKLTVHDKGTYVNMEGPQFSTRAESNLYRSWGMDIIGMTTATEAKLAREAEISYATLAAVTDYDCWRESTEDVTVEMVIANLQQNVENAKKILQIALPRAGALTEFSAAGARKYAIITHPHAIPENKKRELEFL